MQVERLQFQVEPEVVALGVRGVYFTWRGADNRTVPPGFDTWFSRQQDELGAFYSDAQFVRSDAILNGFRRLHERVGRSNRRYVASPEALIARLQRSGNLPRHSPVVDIYNLVSVQSRLALGAHDVDKTDGPVSLRLTTGEESYQPIGSEQALAQPAGEYAYIDAANDVICRMEVMQVEKTKVTAASTDLFFIVQGNLAVDKAALETANQQMQQLLARFCGGELVRQWWVLGA